MRFSLLHGPARDVGLGWGVLERVWGLRGERVVCA